MNREAYGRWWRGQRSFIWPKWRVSLAQDLLSFQVGAGIGLGSFQIYLGPWSLWAYCTKEWVTITAPNPVTLGQTPRDIEQAINRNLFDLL